MNFNIFEGFQKTDFFFFWGGGGGGGYEDFVDIFFFLDHHKIGQYLEVISMNFSEGQGTDWRIFFGLFKFLIFIWGA